MVKRHKGRARPSPCIQKCKLVERAMCTGCHRTLDEIINWGTLEMASCMDVMEQINNTRSTHNCPECRGPAYCAMEAGKSASLCWCMSIPSTVKPNTQLSEECLCRGCLTRHISDTPVTGIQDASSNKK